MKHSFECLILLLKGIGILRDILDQSWPNFLCLLRPHIQFHASSTRKSRALGEVDSWPIHTNRWRPSTLDIVLVLIVEIPPWMPSSTNKFMSRSVNNSNSTSVILR